MSTGNNPKKNQQKAKTARQIEQENEQRTAMNAEAIPFTPRGVTQSQVPASESSKEIEDRTRKEKFPAAGECDEGHLEWVPWIRWVYTRGGNLIVSG